MLKQRLIMAADFASPFVGFMYTCGSNATGGTAQNTATGNTLVPTAAVTSNATWLKICPSKAVNVAGGAGVGILNNGTLWSWGSNVNNGANGHIAQGNNSSPYYVPTQVGSVNTWTDVTQGNGGGLAIRANGTLWSWGVDSSGQLGSGTLNSVRYTPTQVGSATDWAKVWCPNVHTFAIKTNRTLWTFGSNLFYRTGLGTNIAETLTPIQIGSATWIRAVPTTRGGLGIRTDGTLWSWGTDINGELCQGSAGGTYTTPTQVGTDTDWVFVASNAVTAFGLTFLIKANGTLWTAGNNVEYGTGLGTNVGNTTTITQVGTDTNWKEICCAQGFSVNQPTVFGLKTNGTIWSWGLNANGISGQGTTVGNTTVPTQIGSSTGWVRIGDSGSAFFGAFIKA